MKVTKTDMLKWMLTVAVVLSSFGITLAQTGPCKIIFERRTNLYKRFGDEQNVRDWLKEEDKIKTDMFELFINDTCSMFKPQEAELADRFAWATTKSQVYQDFTHHTSYSIKTVWGDDVHIADTMKVRKWQITESTRKIAGYQCRKAIWRVNDSTRIYAWYSVDLPSSTGPETFNGLPGTILGLATEDGGVVYFAKKIDFIAPDKKELQIKRKKKPYTSRTLYDEMFKQYGKEKWFAKEYGRHFGVF